MTHDADTARESVVRSRNVGLLMPQPSCRRVSVFEAERRDEIRALLPPGSCSPRIEEEWGSRPGVTLDHLDGLSVLHDDWWFNVRASNTEPLLRLNAEGKDADTMHRVRDEALAVIRSKAGE